MSKEENKEIPNLDDFALELYEEMLEQQEKEETEKSSKDEKLEEKKEKTDIFTLPDITPYPKMISYIEGPVTLTELKTDKYGGKHIYIFGDYHVKKAICPTQGEKISIADLFLNELVAANKDDPKKVIDIFMETPYINKLSSKKGDLPENTYMQTVQLLFKNCITLDKKSCAINNLRIHNTDVREFDNYLSYTLLNFWFLLEGLIIYRETKSEDSFDKARDMWMRLKNHYIIDNSTDLGNVLDIINNFNLYDNFMKVKIFKQIENIEYSDLKQEFANMINLNITELDKIKHEITDIFSHLYDLFKNKQSEQSKIFQDKKYSIILNTNRLKDVLEKVRNISVSSMDIYLLARLFRNFKSEKLPNKYSDPAKNILIYVGDVHATNYINFFKNIGFEEVRRLEHTNELNRNFQCIDLFPDFDPKFPKNIPLTLPLFATPKTIKRKPINKNI